MRMIEKVAAGFPKGVIPGTAEAARYISSQGSRLSKKHLGAAIGAGAGLGAAGGLYFGSKRKKKDKK